MSEPWVPYLMLCKRTSQLPAERETEIYRGRSLPKGHLNSNWNPGLSPGSPPLRETELGRDLAKKQPLCSVPDPGGGGILSLTQAAQAARGPEP